MKHLAIILLAAIGLQAVYGERNSAAPSTSSTPTALTPDLEKAAEPIDLSLSPETHTLFYNQDYSFIIKDCPTCTVEEVEMPFATLWTIDKNTFKLSVWWTNGDARTVTMRVKVKDTKGNNLPSIEKTISLVQKLPAPYNDNALLKLDDKVIDTDYGVSPSDLRKASKLRFNSTEFTNKKVELKYFKLRIGEQYFESTDGTFTPEMKTALMKIGIGDVITIESVEGVYPGASEPVKFDLKYTFSYRIGEAG